MSYKIKLTIQNISAVEKKFKYELIPPFFGNLFPCWIRLWETLVAKQGEESSVLFS